MNDAHVFIGAHCPRCNITIGLAASIGAPIKCPSCKQDMIAATGSPETHVLANVTCDNCGTKIGVMSVIGGPAKCPKCGDFLS